MKSRMMFVLTLAALFNPISVMAIESSSIACKEWALGKQLKAETQADAVEYDANGKVIQKAVGAH